MQSIFFLKNLRMKTLMKSQTMNQLKRILMMRNRKRKNLHRRNMKIRHCLTNGCCLMKSYMTGKKRMSRFPHFFLMEQNSCLTLICFHRKEQNNCWNFLTCSLCFRFPEQNFLKVRIFSGWYLRKSCFCYYQDWYFR